MTKEWYLSLILHNKLSVCVFSLYSQLSDAVSVIGREDFPQKWTNLLPVSNDREEIPCQGSAFEEQNHFH